MMIPASPADALGSQVHDVSPLLVETIRSVHNRFAQAHQESGSRFAMGYGSLWRDLLEDVRESLTRQGHRTYKLPPAGYKIPVVNDCLIYVWRVPESVSTAASFASSPSRLNTFVAEPLDPLLFEPGFTGEPPSEVVNEVSAETELENIVRSVGNVMPLVLVMVRSSPHELQSIEWAVAELNVDTGKVTLHGVENMLGLELNDTDVTTDVDPFDSGTVTGPAIEPQEQEGTQPDA